MNRLIALLVIGMPASAAALPTTWSELPEKIQTKLIRERAAWSQAELGAADPAGVRTYRFFSAVVMRAGPTMVRRILSDPTHYSSLIPYVSESRVIRSMGPDDGWVSLRGGIFGYELISRVKFEVKPSPAPNEASVHYEIKEGHFTGLKGGLWVDTAQAHAAKNPTDGTLVWITGSVSGTQWPPALVIERGAEIVFDFTAKRMRSYIEDEKHRK